MNIKKFFMSFIIINIFIIIISFNQFEVKATSLKDMEDSASSFIKNGSDQFSNKPISTDKITDQFVGLGQALTMIGAGIMVAVTSYMGIKYMISPPDKQAALKQQLIGLVVAGIIIFGAYGIWKAVIKVVSHF